MFSLELLRWRRKKEEEVRGQKALVGNGLAWSKKVENMGQDIGHVQDMSSICPRTF